MTPLLRYLTKLPVTTSLVKIERKKGAQKIQEVYYVTEKVSPTEEVWEHEHVSEEHATVLYEEVAPLGETVVLSELDVLSTTGKASQRDKKSETRGEISVTDTSKKKETTKPRVIPKTQETIVVVQESYSEDREVTVLEDKPTKERNEEEFFVRTVESPAEEITDERRDSMSVTHLPDKEDSKQETSITVKKGREITIKTGSKGRQVIETTTVKEVELVKDIPSVTNVDQTKPFPVVVSAEARKQAEILEIERKPLTEVAHEESVDQDIQVTTAVPEEKIEKYSRTEEITEITIKPREDTVKDKPTNVIPPQVKTVDKETGRIEETQIKRPVVIDSKKDVTSAPGKVSVKTYEVAEEKQKKKLTSGDITDTKKEKVTEKPKAEVEVTPKVKPKESVTDIDPKKPKVIEQENDVESAYKKKDESKCIPPHRGDAEKKNEEATIFIEDTAQTKPSVPLKPKEEKRISPQPASRGTERKSNILIISIVDCFI